MFAVGRSLPLALATQLVRFALIAGVLAIIASHFGALPLLAASRRNPGGADGRRSIWSPTVIGSPLATKTLFTVGPVPITEPVVVTWGLMAALALAGFLATRSLTLCAVSHQAVLELIVGSN